MKVYQSSRIMTLTSLKLIIHPQMSGIHLLAGAETGAGGRIRDTHATGTGSIMGASTAGYCVGNLLVDGYDAPWEDSSEPYSESLAPPLQVALVLEVRDYHCH